LSKENYSQPITLLTVRLILDVKKPATKPPQKIEAKPPQCLISLE